MENILSSVGTTFVRPGRKSNDAKTHDNLLTQSSDLKVEVRIFSGRPNPTWDISSEQVSQLLSKILSLRDTQEDIAYKGLGYNGFLVTKTDDSYDTPENIELNNGIVVVNYNNKRKSKYLDPRRALESWIVKTGAESLGQELVKYVEKKIKSS